MTVALDKRSGNQLWSTPLPNLQEAASGYDEPNYEDENQFLEWDGRFFTGQ